MLGKRYITYLFYLNAVLGVTAFVPQILYKNSVNGSILSMCLAAIVGGFFIYIIQKVIVQFPKQNINQILKNLVPKWFRKCFVIYSFILWYLTGALFIIALIHVVNIYINPDTPIIVTYFIFLLLITFAISLKTESLLYVTEIVVLLHIPIFLFIIIRFLTDHFVLGDSIYQSIKYISHFPKFSAFTSALFLFTGFSNLIIFNEQININFIRKSYIIGIFFLGIFILLCLYFIPIGYLGLKGVHKAIFVWLTTIDSMRFEYSFVERVSYIILFVHIVISLIYIILSWHTSLALFKTLNIYFGGKFKWLLISFFICVTTVFLQLIREIDLIKYFIVFFNFRAISDFFLVILLMYVLIKKKQVS
ncbi:GerAB/ArcD/ProY family transporter [Gottfriedia endophytica]|uniref:GerAB/ArcD/ProY family transporter n=1 Tax=Gottfriedia endophytica TaxID=2820819 RepID=UPI002AC34389|nr:GerAB/ArcD/ProY family transporter [Gottfriedia endophytica]